MRFLSLAALAALVFAVPALAQPTFGVKAGVNVANFSGADADGSEARLGLVGGLTVQVPVTPSVSLQAEALYSQKGEEYLNSVDRIEETTLNYLEIPISARFALPVDPTLDLGLSVGGYVGVPLKGEVEVDGLFSSELDLATDYGALVGVDVGSGPFFVDARYTFGLANAIEYDPGIDEFDLEKRNQVFSITAGFRFGGGGRGYGRY